MKLLQTARNELEQTLADVIGSPVIYLILASETDLDCYGDFLGLTEPRLAVCFRDCIGDRWRGNGPAGLLDDRAILQYRHGHVGDAIDLMAAIAVHEVAHIVTRPQLYRREPTPNGYRASLATVVSTPETLTDRPANPSQRHDVHFTRAALHIAHRVKASGRYVPVAYLMDWNEIAISGPWNYGGALGDELEQMESEPLANVLQSPIPSEFTELFENDRAYVGSV